jgi:NADPH:quinone reductase-like Zn-dependent oxidoreductase
VAGRIEAVGSGVRGFKVGDEIWGDLSYPNAAGAFAEYVCIPQSALRLKPASMTFEEAAATPTAGVVALQNLVARGPVQAGQSVLINGAGGGVGTFAVQLAKHFGAEITGVDSSGKFDMLRSLGADHVIDYTEVDFTNTGQQYDLILDVVASRSPLAYRRALNPNGTFIYIGGSISVVFLGLILGRLISRLEGKYLGLGEWKPNDQADLDFLTELFEAGKVVPVIERSCSLGEVPEAFRQLDEGSVLGKLVITVGQNGNA